MRWDKCAAVLPAGCARVSPDEETATPHVNNAILADVFFRPHLQFVHEFVTQHACPGFADGVALLKIWLRQRGIDSAAFGAFNGFAATLLVVHLFQSRAVRPIFFSFFFFLA